MSDLDIEHLRKWIGKKEVRSELLTTSLVERFNATFDLNNEATEGDPAPSLVHLCLAPPAAPTGELGPDGHPARGGFLPPVPLPRRMWAGGAFTFQDAIIVGELVTRTSTIRDVVIKEGRTGALCFVTVDHQIDCNGRLVVDERQDIVYRGEDSPGSAKKATEPAPNGAHKLTVAPSPMLLFRYSALTFNGHRIHYDAPYAQNAEGYPGLIVHGPMQATMLLQFAEMLGGRRPAQFDFRSLSPLFDNKNFLLHATEEAEGLRLWTAAENGRIAMEAKVNW